MEYSLGDLADRLTILSLKMERIEKGPLEEEWSVVHEAFSDGVCVMSTEEKRAQVGCLVAELRLANEGIWDLESDIRMGREGQIGLEEVGRRAIAIRDLNERRVRLKNKINILSGTGFQEKKSTWRV